MRKPTLRTICTALFLETLAYTIVVPVYAKFAASAMVDSGGSGGASAEDRAASFTAFWNVVGNLLKFVCTPIVGRFSDQVGRRQLLLLSAGAQPVLFLAVGLVARPWAIAMAICSTGLLGIAFSMLAAMMADVHAADAAGGADGVGGAGGGVGGAAGGGAVVGGAAGGAAVSRANRADVERTGRHFGLLLTAVFCALIVGMPLGSAAAASPAGLGGAFVLSAAVGAANFAFVALRLEETLVQRQPMSWARLRRAAALGGDGGGTGAGHEASSAGAVSCNPFAAVLSALRGDALLLSLAPVFFLATLGNSASASTFVFYTLYRFDWGPAELSLFLGATALLAIGAFTLLLPRAQARLPSRSLLLLSYGASALAAAGMGLATSSAAMYALLLPSVLGFLKSPTLRALMTEQLPSAQQGTLQSVLDAIKALGGSVGPYVAVTLFRAGKGSWANGSARARADAGSGAPFFLVAVLCALNALLVARLPRGERTAPRGTGAGGGGGGFAGRLRQFAKLDVEDDEEEFPQLERTREMAVFDEQLASAFVIDDGCGSDDDDDDGGGTGAGAAAESSDMEEVSFNFGRS